MFEILSQTVIYNGNLGTVTSARQNDCQKDKKILHNRNLQRLFTVTSASNIT
jgi:hypothetical protein